MKLHIVRGFLSQAECETLNDIARAGVAAGWVSTGIDRGKKSVNRLTSRFYGSMFQTPVAVLEISARIREAVGVSDWPLIGGHGRDGVVVSHTSAGGDVYEHCDPTIPRYAALRCNVMTQKPVDGGVLYLEDDALPLEQGDLHCYLASEHRHRVSVVSGDTPRILWMFGAYVSADDWNTGKIGPK